MIAELFNEFKASGLSRHFKTVSNLSVFVAYRPVGGFQMNEYLVVDPATKAGALIDCGEDVEDYFKPLIERLGVNLTHLLHTHGHLDHIMGVAATKKAYPNAKICLHPKDLILYKNLEQQCQMFGYAMQSETPPPIDVELKEDDVVAVGESKFIVIMANGHTPGQVVFRSESNDVVFTGDFLFKGSVGRTDFYLSDPKLMEENLKKVFTWHPDLVVLSGHGNPTKVADEIKNNVFLRRLRPKHL